MKLFTVKVEAEFVCLAEDEIDAECAAREALSDGSGVEFFAEPMRFLPLGWDGTELPWVEGDAPEQDVNAWIAQGAAPELTKRMAERRATQTGSAAGGDK